MANWGPLRDRLAVVEQRVTLGWTELDELVGGLPPSAYRHSAFWKGDRSGWPGFTTADVRVGERVTFVRQADIAQPQPRSVRAEPESADEPADTPDLVLVGCVKMKRDYPSPAKDLYVSALFRKARTYAEATGAPCVANARSRRGAGLIFTGHCPDACARSPSQRI